MKTIVRFACTALLSTILALSLGGCGQIADAIAALTSADCDDFLQNEATATLAEECQELEDYLDAESDSLTSVSQMLPTVSIADAGSTFVQLTDAEGNPLSDISEDNVTVSVSTDGGQTYEAVAGETVQTLSEVETAQASFLIDIDYSGSISDSDLADVVSGLDVFLETLTVGYRGAVMKFATDVDMIQDFTEDETLVAAAVDDTSYARSLTSLYDAIYDGVTALTEETMPLRLMVLFTDGIDNDSTRTLDETIAYAQDNNIPVCVVGVTFADTAVLQRIAEETGCFYIYKNFFASLDETFRAFAEQINNFQMVTLPDSFDTATGLLKIEVDAGEGTVREFTQEF